MALRRCHSGMADIDLSFSSIGASEEYGHREVTEAENGKLAS